MVSYDDVEQKVDSIKNNVRSSREAAALMQLFARNQPYGVVVTRREDVEFAYQRELTDSEWEDVTRSATWQMSDFLRLEDRTNELLYYTEQGTFTQADDVPPSDVCVLATEELAEEFGMSVRVLFREDVEALVGQTLADDVWEHLNRTVEFSEGTWLDEESVTATIRNVADAGNWPERNMQ